MITICVLFRIVDSLRNALAEARYLTEPFITALSCSLHPGPDAPTPTCCQSPAWWSVQGGPTTTGWGPTTLTTCSTCLGSPSPPPRLMGTPRETSQATSSPTGPTLPGAGKNKIDKKNKQNPMNSAFCIHCDMVWIKTCAQLFTEAFAAHFYLMTHNDTFV